MKELLEKVISQNLSKVQEFIDGYDEMDNIYNSLETIASEYVNFDFQKMEEDFNILLENFEDEIISICNGCVSLATMKQIEDTFSKYKEIEGFMNGVWDEELFKNFSKDLDRLTQIINEGTY